MLFVGVIVLLLWLTQSVFLDKIYKAVKINDIQNSALQITENIDSDDLKSRVGGIAENSDMCVSIVNMDTYPNTLPLFSPCTFQNCAVHNIGRQSILKLYEAAAANNGSSIQRFMYDYNTQTFIGIEGSLFENDRLEEYRGKLPESIIYSVITKNAESEEFFVILNAEITPVEATVNTLNRILLFLVIGLSVMALALALIISNRVSSPIRKLTKGAVKLADGNYDVEFERRGYKEISQLADALNYAETELSQTNKLRSELIANISHDLRTPLTMIEGYSEMMRDIPGENNAENVQVIIDETKRLTSLVNDVLYISKLESGIGEINFSTFNLTQSIKEVLDRFSKLCEKDGYTIEFLCGDDITVNCDQGRLTQVIYNLVGNAMTHTGMDKSVRVRQMITQANTVRIEVSDTGEGIEADKLPLIWDRYYKVDKVHKRSRVGTGLGLSIVKTIMQQLGGAYGVTSTPGAGSTFFIEIPLIEDTIDEQK